LAFWSMLFKDIGVGVSCPHQFCGQSDFWGEEVMPEVMHSKHQLHCSQSHSKMDWAGSIDKQISQSLVFAVSMVYSSVVYLELDRRYIEFPQLIGV
jgi:hypothetical protein